MTTHQLIRDEAPDDLRARPTPRSLRLAALLLSLCIVVSAGWWLGQAVAKTGRQPGTRLYPVDYAGAQWIAAPGGGPRAYCRTSFDLTATPDRAILWTDANQRMRLFVDGHRSSANLSSVRGGVPARALMTDLTPTLAVGHNALTVQITNLDKATALMRATLTVATGASVTHLVSNTTAWRCTSDPTKLVSSGSLRFFDAGFDDGRWSVPVVAAAPRDPAPSPVPQALVERGLTAPLLHTGDSSDLLAQTTVDVSSEPVDGWIRVAANGSYTIFLDGHQICFQSVSANPTSPGSGRVSRVHSRGMEIRLSGGGWDCRRHGREPGLTGKGGADGVERGQAVADC